MGIRNRNKNNWTLIFDALLKKPKGAKGKLYRMRW